MSSSKLSGQYEVLGPWAETDPVPLRGISPRLTDLAGKKIGVFRNFKPAAEPIGTMIERKLKERFPTSEITWYESNEPNILETETENKAKFEKWAKGIDAAIAVVGD